MNKLITFIFFSLLPITSSAEDIPNQNAEGMKKVQGMVINIDHVDSSRRGSATTGMPVVDLVEAIFGSNYSGFPIYLVKVSESITLEVASRESFRIGDCVLVWFGLTKVWATALICLCWVKQAYQKITGVTNNDYT